MKKNIAMIPARIGSTRLKMKNLAFKKNKKNKKKNNNKKKIKINELNLNMKT